MANCNKCGKTKLRKNGEGIYWCKRCGGRHRPLIQDYAPVPAHLKLLPVGDQIAMLTEQAHAEAVAAAHVPLWVWAVLFAPVGGYLILQVIANG